MCNNESENTGERIREIPEDIEWPRYEDGALVDVGDLLRQGMVVGVEMRTEGYHIECLYGSVERPYGERIERPPFSADGVLLEAGDTVWNATTGEKYRVVDARGGYAYLSTDGGVHVNLKLLAGAVTHVRPVLDADGVPIKKGDTVYFTDGREQECNTVVNAKYDYEDEPYVQLGRLNEAGHPTYTNCFCIDPSQLTHTKPEPKRLCRDCRHWQGDPSASHMGVCFNSYRERCCVDSYAAQLDYAKACEDFEGRGE